MEEVIANIRSALISTKGSSNIQQLQKDYREIVGEFIPFKKFGYPSLESFLQSVSSLKVTRLPNGMTIVDAVATDNVKHIVNLVNKQRNGKKKVGYVASKFRPNGYGNKSPGYTNRPNRSPGFAPSKYKPRFDQYKPREAKFTPQYKPKEPTYAQYRPKEPKYQPKPVGNKRRLSVFERLGPKVEVSSEENFSTVDEDDDFVDKFQSSRRVSRMPQSTGKMSLPPNIKIQSPIKTSTRFLKQTNEETTEKTGSKSPSSDSSEHWADAVDVLQQVDDLNNGMSRLSLMRERIASRQSMPALNNANHAPELVFNNNLPIVNNNDRDRPRMRYQQAPPSFSGATRPRPAFVAPSTIRPMVPRFNQNRFISSIRLPWQPEDKKVVMVETTVDHRIRKEETIPQPLEKFILDVEDDTKEVVVSTSKFEVPKLSPTYKIETIKRWSDISALTFPNTSEESNILDVQIPDNYKMEPVKSKISKWTTIPKLNQFLDVKISHIIDPYCFFIQPVNSSPILNSLMGRIQEKYSNNPTRCDLENVVPEEFYAYKHEDDFWYRVKVTNFVSPTEVNIFFCDFGYELETPASNLFSLGVEFHETPFQIIKAKLIGIRPNNCTWTMEETNYFSERVLGKSFVSLVSLVENKDELVLGVKLFDTAGDDDINIGKEMIQNYVAQFDFSDV